MLSKFIRPIKPVLSTISVQRASFASKDHFYKISQHDETRTDLMEMVESFADAEVAPLA